MSTESTRTIAACSGWAFLGFAMGMLFMIVFAPWVTDAEENGYDWAHAHGIHPQHVGCTRPPRGRTQAQCAIFVPGADREVVLIYQCDTEPNGSCRPAMQEQQ